MTRISSKFSPVCASIGRQFTRRKNAMKRLITLYMMLGLCLFQGSALALLTNVTVNPAGVTLAVNRPASINLTWTLVASPTNNIPTTATSSEIVITDPGQDVIYGTIPRTLSRTITPGGSGILSETAQIPRSVIEAMKRARDANGNPLSAFVLLRNFTDDNFSFVSAMANLYLTGGSAASLLQIDRLALTFDDLSTVRLIPKDETLNALLDVQFSGSGQLRGVWELATPASTMGEPIYTNLRLVRQALVGNQTIRLKSPDLPTNQEGVYLLRFRVTEPETGFEPVTIRYLVTASTAQERPPLNVQLLSPAQGALISAETRFAWRGVDEAKAKAWQLEIYEKPQTNALDQLPDLGGAAQESSKTSEVEGPPVAGMLLQGETREIPLSKMARGHLKQGQGYWWRVRAIGSEGIVIGESPLLEFRTP
jgi:hypothetical protein